MSGGAPAAPLAGTCSIGFSVEDLAATCRELSTALRNAGVGLVIARGNFPGTTAVAATLVYKIFEIICSLLRAWVWGRPRETWRL